MPQRFAQEDITRACLAYLGRWREFDSPDKMKRIVSLLHRQAVKAKAEGLFFKVRAVAMGLDWQVISLNPQVSTLELFNRILAHQKDLPRDRPYKDLLHLINFVLRKFFKTMEEQPLLMLEVVTPDSVLWRTQLISTLPGILPEESTRLEAIFYLEASYRAILKT